MFQPVRKLCTHRPRSSGSTAAVHEKAPQPAGRFLIISCGWADRGAGTRLRPTPRYRRSGGSGTRPKLANRCLSTSPAAIGTGFGARFGGAVPSTDAAVVGFRSTARQRFPSRYASNAGHVDPLALQATAWRQSSQGARSGMARECRAIEARCHGMARRQGCGIFSGFRGGGILIGFRSVSRSESTASISDGTWSSIE